MSIQIKKKFLRSQSVDGSKVLFLNEDTFKALKSDGSEAALFKLDSQNKFQLLEMPRVSSDPSHESELARKAYVDAGDAAEALARIAGDVAEQAAREAEDAAIRAEFAAADALGLLEAKDYTDEKVSEEAAMRSAEDADIRSDFTEADLIEKTAREAADQLLRDDLDSEIATRTSEDARVLSESKAYTDAEKARAMAAEAAEATLRASEDVRILNESKAYTDAEVFAEETRAMAAEAELRSDLDQEIADRIADVNAEEAARAAEDLTFLKLDGSRAMEGDLDMESGSSGSTGIVASYSVNPGSSPGIYTVMVTLNDPTNIFQYGGNFWQQSSSGVGPASEMPPQGNLLTGLEYLPGNYGSATYYLVPNDSTSTADFAAAVKIGVLDFSKTDNTAFVPEGGIGGTVKHKIIGLADGVDAYDAVNKGQLDFEKARAMAAEAALQAEIDAEELLRASEDARILSESKAYTDSSIASVIDAAPEAYDTLREIAEYIASDQTATSQILSQLYDHETRLDVIEGTGEGSIAKAEADAMAYTDAEKARAMAAEAVLQSEIDAEEVLRASEDVRVLDEAKAYTDVEKARAMGQEAAIRSEFAAADAAIRLDLDDLDGYAQEIRSDLDDLDGYAQEIRSDLDQEIADRIADVDAEEARAMAAEAAETAARVAADLAEATLRASEDIRVLGEAKAYTDAEVLAEKTRAMAAEAAIQSELDAEEARAMAVEAQLQSEIDAEEVLRASEDVRVLSESKTYTDQKVAAVIDSAPEMLDTLRELAQALGNDENFATSVTGYIAAAKEEAKDYTEQQVDAFGERLMIESFEIDAMMISNNYIELQYKAFGMSIVASVDRLMMLEQEDYEASVQNGKTRLTFAGSMLQGEAEALAVGDKIRVRYLKDVRS
jgi:hypothetical protein